MIRKTVFFAFLLVIAGFSASSQSATDRPKPSRQEKNTLEYLESQSERLAGIAHQIWEWAELGYQEYKSAGLLQENLRAEGFEIKAGVADIPTAFVASYGSGEPVIGILAEYDALPGVSQDMVPYPKERPDCKSGHACGHHLFGTASMAAAIAVKRWMQQTGQKGTIRLYGCPAEEGGGGKVYMVRAGLFDDVTAVLHWHPGNSNSAVAGSSLANKSAKFRFYGNASHAAASPWNGRSGLDGVEAMNHMVNMMREHVPQETRIHYVITKGGDAPNVVPAFAEAFYYVRHPEMEHVKSIFERVVKAAEGAALGTGVRMEYEVIHGIYNLLPNATLGEVIQNKLEIVGGVIYNEEEKKFAEELMKTYNPEGATIASAAVVEPFRLEEKGVGGSTDVGDVSWMVPTAGLTSATWAPGTSAHSWQAVAAGGTTIGQKGMMVAAKTLALAVQELFQDPEKAARAKTELLNRRGADFRYESLVGDRKPPLNYRN